MTATDEQVSQVVALAVGAAGEAGSDMAAWRERVLNLVQQIGLMVQPSSAAGQLAALALGAKPIYDVEYLGYDYEESSTRCVMKIKTRPSKWYKDGIEPLRTQRTTSALGRRQKAQLDAIPVGSRVLVFKGDERIDDDGTTVRVLVDIQVLQHGTGHAEAPPERPTTGRARRLHIQEGDEPSAEKDLREAAKAWQFTAQHKTEIQQELVAAEAWPPTYDNIDRAIVVLREYAREHRVAPAPEERP